MRTVIAAPPLGHSRELLPVTLSAAEASPRNRVFVRARHGRPDDPTPTGAPNEASARWVPTLTVVTVVFSSRTHKNRSLSGRGQLDSAVFLIAARVMGMPLRAASARLAICAGASSPNLLWNLVMPSVRNSHDSVTCVPPSTGVKV